MNLKMLLISKLQNGSYVNAGSDWNDLYANGSYYCWEVLESRNTDTAPTVDPQFLDRLHIITVFIVGLGGSILVLFLLLCACLNNETVAEMVCKKKSHLPKKGIEGYFPFGAEMVSTDSSNNNNNPPSQQNVQMVEIPILIEPPENTMSHTPRLGTPGIPVVGSLASDDISFGSFTEDYLGESPKQKKVDFLDTNSIKTDHNEG